MCFVAIISTIAWTRLISYIFKPNDILSLHVTCGHAHCLTSSHTMVKVARRRQFTILDCIIFRQRKRSRNWRKKFDVSRTQSAGKSTRQNWHRRDLKTEPTDRTWSCVVTTFSMDSPMKSDSSTSLRDLSRTNSSRRGQFSPLSEVFFFFFFWEPMTQLAVDMPASNSVQPHPITFLSVF